ncbi:DUF1877 family protein [Undibacterium aquatile]|uniref:DUF1877 family protein n=1 Tax=Undibacterium aquatile TaxID=1537398 RepID=A0ABR6XAW9_9BURK|nr:DUF1877 family protein [Undibacterium aquatile]MBC3809863.1 DUF1877 family protein [Undibacterium aquatile]
MSVIAYYVHVDEGQLQYLREQPALVWNIKSDPRFASAVLFDVDKDYDLLAWLASEKKRKEQAQQIASYRAIDRESKSGTDYDKAEFTRVMNDELQKLGVSPEDTNAIPTDPALEAIEGRGKESQRDPKINLGMGNARHFTPSEVTKLADALGRITEADLRRSFNRAEMAKFDVGGIGWLEEEDSVFEEFLLPAFRGLQGFYRKAAKSGHHVLVIYQ